MDDSISIPNGYRLRPPRGDEATDIARLSAEADEAVGAPPTLSEVLLRRMWARPHFDLAMDAWLVERDGALAGYGQVWAADPERLSAFVIVHPGHTGRGIGSALAELVERRSAELAAADAVRLVTAVIPQDEAGARLLSDRGYTWARRFWHMDIDLAEPADGGEPPPGIRVRAMEAERELPAVHRVLEEALGDHWDFIPTSYEEFLDQNVHQEDFDPGLWFVAIDAGDPVGVATASAHEGRASIDLVGVLRTHRGRGVASALLRGAFAEFRRRGLTHAQLSVDSDNPTGAVSLYERMGMRVGASYDLWGRTVQGTRS